MACQKMRLACADLVVGFDTEFVRVDISDRDGGFSPGANQMARIDAFARLSLTTPCVELSPRVPSEAYGITEVYSR